MKKVQSNRINFEKNVPEILYRRAGSRCSVPRCTRPTSGPFLSREEAVNVGMACHIYSAAPNGPRGRGGRDDLFIRSVENGIWCCTYHGNLIDKSNGADYPANTLFAWKKLAEARVLKQMNDTPSPLGWVESIEFTEFAKRDKLPKVNLSRCTLLFGANGSGKSVLMEAAASVSHGRYAERFSDTFLIMPDGIKQPAVFHAKVVYSTVDTLSKEINLKVVGDELTRHEGHVPCLLPPGDIEIIYASDSDLYRKEGEDDVDMMIRILGVDKSALFALAQIGTKSIMPGEIKFNEAEDEDDDGNASPRYKENGRRYIELTFKSKQNDFFITYAALSGSEKGRLILDMLITKAREVCKQRLTLLLVDNVIYNFDEGNFSSLLKKLANEEFQSLVTLPPAREKDTLEIINNEKKLKSVDFLEPWKLATLNALDSTYRNQKT